MKVIAAASMFPALALGLTRHFVEPFFVFSVIIAALGFWLSYCLIPTMKDYLGKKLSGKDLNKRGTEAGEISMLDMFELL
jgi:hypothetical protein